MTEQTRDSPVRTDYQYSGLSRGQARIVQVYSGVLSRLPETFHSSLRLKRDADCDVPYVDVESNRLRTMTARDCLICVEKRRRRGSPQRIWSVPEAVHQRAKELVDQRETAIPGCPHSGIRNIPDSDRYTCTDDGCANTVPREEVRR